MRKLRVELECRFIRPARVDIEQPRIAHRTIGVDHQTTWLLAGWADDIAQRRRDGILLPLTGMEAGEYEQFRRPLLLRLPLAKLEFERHIFSISLGCHMLSEATPYPINAITEASIAEMVHAFYRKVRADAILGPVFNGAIAEAAWPAHLDTMCRFWSAVMLTSGRYSGNPVAKHQAVAAIEQSMFDRWLALWQETASELFIASIAAEFMLKATRIGASLQMAIFRRLPAKHPA